jgi:hypothetical protein
VWCLGHGNEEGGGGFGYRVILYREPQCGVSVAELWPAAGTETCPLDIRFLLAEAIGCVEESHLG